MKLHEETIIKNHNDVSKTVYSFEYLRITMNKGKNEYS